MSLDPTASESRAQSAFQSLSAVIGSLPGSPQFSDNPSHYLLHNPDVSRQISGHLRQADSGAGDDNLCRWLYDTFQSMDPELQLVVLQFVPTIAGVYLTRALLRKPQAGFEAVLLALYAHETMSRGGQPLTVNISSLSHPSLYHENKNNNPSKNRAVELNLAILSPALEPHGTVRSTKRARIVGVALELYYTKIWMMPISSKVDFCEFCVAWAGQDGCEEEEEEEMEGSQCSVHHSDEIGGEVVSCDSDPEEGGGGEVPTGGESGEKGGRIPLPWELFQPILRILGHCLLGPSNSEELRSSAMAAVRCLYARAIHDMMPPAILAARSLLRLGKMRSDSNGRLLDFGALGDLRDAAETLSITGS